MSQTSGRAEPGFRLTGPKVLLILVTFFVVIFAANGALIYLALDSWPGLDNTNAYREGLLYDQEIEAAREQDARGWKVDATVGRSDDGVVVMRLDVHDRDGRAVNGLDVKVAFKRPTDTLDDKTMVMKDNGLGAYGGQLEGLVTGAWTLDIEMLDPSGERVYRSRNRLTLR